MSNGEAEQKEDGLIPFLSMKLTDLGRDYLTDVPTYIRKVSYIIGIMDLDGQLNGQPFSAVYPTTVFGGQKNFYISFYFPQQGIRYSQRMKGTEGHESAILYVNQKPEERDVERQVAMKYMFLGTGRLVLSTDDDVNEEDVKRLHGIVDHFWPTIVTLYGLLSTSEQNLERSRGTGTVETLVVPDDGSETES